MRSAAVLLMLVAGGCSTKVNQAAFGVATDLTAAQLDGVTIDVGGMQTSFTIEGANANAYLPGLVVAYTVGEKLPSFEITVTATLQGAPVVVRSARTTLLPEQTRFIRLGLAQSCVGVGCAADQTCVEGSCQPVDVDLSRALPYEQGQENAFRCGMPGYRATTDDSLLVQDPNHAGCDPGQLCVEGTCYAPPGAPPVAGAGQFAVGSLVEVQLP
jgi:hypothetical protein